MRDDPVPALLDTGYARLAEGDPRLLEILAAEQRRQAETLSLVASCGAVDPAVLFCQGSAAVNVTAEGYPGARYQAGCAAVDDIERLAVARARLLFRAGYANVQPHSATTANYAVLTALLRPGDTLLGMALDSGGHLTHGSPAAFSGRYFQVVRYGVSGAGLIDHAEVAGLAERHRPRVIVCGATAYPRRIDFAAFRRIADSVGAYLVADISHTAGLVATRLHPSPVEHAHVTTTCTHKQLFGPRGGLILSGRDHAEPAPTGTGTLADLLDRAVFPYFQGAPAMNVVAAKAAALRLAGTPGFASVMRRVIATATAIAGRLAGLGYRVVSGGTDNHLVLVDLAGRGLTGLVAERALEDCGIIVNKNRVPGDTSPARVTGGIRIGTNGIAQRGLSPADAVTCADMIDDVLGAVTPLDGDRFRVDERVRTRVRGEVARLCAAFPLPVYPLAAPVRDSEPMAL